MQDKTGMMEAVRRVLLRARIASSPQIEALHFYTFNQVESTEAWRNDWLATIGN